MNNLPSIFVQIAAYRDPEIVPTILDCLSKAEHPERLTFGICCQDDHFEHLDQFKTDSRFKFVEVPYQESKGACWARSKINDLYNKEDFTLQIDSHMRFVKNWDTFILDLWKNLNDPKAIFTTYPAEYYPTKPESTWGKAPHIIQMKGFKNGETEQHPYTPPNWDQRTTPYRARHVAAGFIFGPGSLIEDVPYDPQHYFSGEETSLMVRFFTHGYNVFHPHKLILWHYYTRSDQPKHWSDDKQWGALAVVAKDRLYCLLGRNNNHDLGKYGLGKARTLEDFQNYTGIDFKRCVLHLDVLDTKEPPVDLTNKYRWSYETKTFKKKMMWKFEDIDKMDDPRFWAFIFKDQNDHELYRKDITYAENKDLLDGKVTEYEFEFKHYTPAQVPAIFMIWPYSESKGWLKNKIWNI